MKFVIYSSYDSVCHMALDYKDFKKDGEFVNTQKSIMMILTTYANK